MMRISIVAIIISILFIQCESGGGVEQEVLGSYVKTDIKEDNFQYKGENMNGKYRIQYDDGHYTLGNFKDGRPIDTLKSFHSNNELRKLAPFTAEGVHHGSEIWYYNDGSVWSTRKYVDGLREGEETVFFKGEKDKISVLSIYEHDYLISKKEFYKDGSIKYEMLVDKEKNIQSQKKYYPNGNIQSIKQFKDGQRFGDFVDFNQNGTRREASVYDDQGNLKKKIEYDAAGNEKQTMLYQ